MHVGCDAAVGQYSAADTSAWTASRRLIGVLCANAMKLWHVHTRNADWALAAAAACVQAAAVTPGAPVCPCALLSLQLGAQLQQHERQHQQQRSARSSGRGRAASGRVAVCCSSRAGCRAWDRARPMLWQQQVEVAEGFSWPPSSSCCCSR